jgi:hypothetical protein
MYNNLSAYLFFRSTCQSVRSLLDDVGIRNIVDVVVISGNHCDLAIVTFSDEDSLKVGIMYNNIRNCCCPEKKIYLSTAQK